MKVISKEEETAHYNQVLKGGLIGGTAGIAVGLAGVLGASRRYAAFRALTLPFRTFLVTSSASFGAIITAERYSVRFHKAKDPMNFYKDDAQVALEQARREEGAWQRFVEWGRANRYTIVGVSWLASMGLALTIVGRNRFLTTSQKIVQARVYAQGLTLAVLIATAAFEGSDARSGQGRWETVMVLDPDDPTHKHMIEKRVHKEEYAGEDLWKDMVAAEERRLDAKKNNGSKSDKTNGEKDAETKATKTDAKTNVAAKSLEADTKKHTETTAKSGKTDASKTEASKTEHPQKHQ